MSFIYPGMASKWNRFRKGQTQTCLWSQIEKPFPHAHEARWFDCDIFQQLFWKLFPFLVLPTKHVKLCQRLQRVYTTFIRKDIRTLCKLSLAILVWHIFVSEHLPRAKTSACSLRNQGCYQQTKFISSFSLQLRRCRASLSPGWASFAVPQPKTNLIPWTLCSVKAEDWGEERLNTI